MSGKTRAAECRVTPWVNFNVQIQEVHRGANLAVTNLNVDIGSTHHRQAGLRIVPGLKYHQHIIYVPTK
jgi:hypothetical protein